MVVDAGIDDERAVDRDVPVVLRQTREDVVAHILRLLPNMLPDEVTRDGVDGLDDVVRVRHVHDPVVHQRGALLAPGRHGARPDHAELVHVVPVDPIERAVAPAVQRPAPHQPIVGARVLQLGVGDGPDAILLREDRRRGHDREGGDDDARDERRAEPERRPAGCGHDASSGFEFWPDYVTRTRPRGLEIRHPLDSSLGGHGHRRHARTAEIVKAGAAAALASDCHPGHPRTRPRMDERGQGSCHAGRALWGFSAIAQPRRRTPDRPGTWPYIHPQKPRRSLTRLRASTIA